MIRLYDLLDVNYVGIIPRKDLFIETLIKGNVSVNPHPLLKLIKGSLLYKEGVLSLLSFIRELYIQPMILKSERERIARIIFSEMLNFYNVFPEKIKNLLKAKLSVDFYLLQDSLPQVLEIFEEEWQSKKSSSNFGI